MIYHKSINLEGWKAATFNIYKYVKQNTSILEKKMFWNILTREKHSYCYEQLDPVFLNAGFNLLRISFLALHGEEGEIHQDSDTIPGYPERVARVNLPVLNCEGSETHFYSANNWEPMTKELANGIKYIYHDPENCKLESTVTINEPTILRVRELHQVVNHAKTYPRITLTCAVDPDPVYLLEEK